MQRKKRVGVFLTLIVISIFAISIVSASWFTDLFKSGDGGEGLEGELETANVNVGVNITGAGAPPRIVYVSDIDATVTGFVYPIAAGIKLVQFSFVANSSSSSNLPPNGGVASGNIKGMTGGETTRYSASCSKSAALSPAYDPAYYANYTCVDIPIKWYDGPGGTQWMINATITDINGQKAENSTKRFSMGNTFQTNITPKYLNWSSVTIGPSINQKADIPNIRVYNIGNVNMVQLTVNGTNLTGLVGGDKLPVASFTVDPAPVTCSATNNRLIDETNKISGLTVVKGSVGTEMPLGSLDFCLKEALGISTDFYNATRPWILTDS